MVLFAAAELGRWKCRQSEIKKLVLVMESSHEMLDSMLVLDDRLRDDRNLACVVL